MPQQPFVRCSFLLVQAEARPHAHVCNQTRDFGTVERRVHRAVPAHARDAAERVRRANDARRVVQVRDAERALRERDLLLQQSAGREQDGFFAVRLHEVGRALFRFRVGIQRRGANHVAVDCQRSLALSAVRDALGCDARVLFDEIVAGRDCVRPAQRAHEMKFVWTVNVLVLLLVFVLRVFLVLVLVVVLVLVFILCFI